MFLFIGQEIALAKPKGYRITLSYVINAAIRPQNWSNLYDELLNVNQDVINPFDLVESVRVITLILVRLAGNP